MLPCNVETVEECRRYSFELRYRKYMEKNGCSYDPWDIREAWKQYQEAPEKYQYIDE